MQGLLSIPLRGALSERKILWAANASHIHHLKRWEKNPNNILFNPSYLNTSNGIILTCNNTQVINEIFYIVLDCLWNQPVRYSYGTSLFALATFWVLVARGCHMGPCSPGWWVQCNAIQCVLSTKILKIQVIAIKDLWKICLSQVTTWLMKLGSVCN